MDITNANAISIPCAQVYALLDDYRAGSLPVPLSAQVATHLARCRVCADFGHALADAEGLLDTLPRAAAPSALWPAVRDRVADRYAVLDTPMGAVGVAYTAAGIRYLALLTDTATFERDYRLRYRRPLLAEPVPPSSVTLVLDRFWQGDRLADLKIDLVPSNPFQGAVLAKIRHIPRGEVRPYAWVAKEIGYPKAVRAVGSALRDNPLPLLIPCHRVVRSDGTIGQYAWGETAKRYLLGLEGVDAGALAAGIKAGALLHGSRTTKIFCLPTCQHARRVRAEYRVTFPSATEAQAAGYRPCKVCRPAC